MRHDEQIKTVVDELSPRETRQMREDLGNVGFFSLGVGYIVIGVLLMGIVWQSGVSLFPSLLVGGIIGLCFALSHPGIPTRAFPPYTAYPKELTPYEQRLSMMIQRRCERSVMVLASAPIFAVGLLYLMSGRDELTQLTLTEYVFSGVFAGLHVALVARGAQYLYVRQSLQE